MIISVDHNGNIMELPDEPARPFSPQEVLDQKWAMVGEFVRTLTITSSLGNTFAANNDSLLEIGKRIMNPVPSTTIAWDEAWGQFNTSTVELQEVYTKAIDTIQAYKDSIFGVPA